MLFNVHSNQWDEELLTALDIPASLMPAVKASSTVYGEVHPDLLGAAIPIGGVQATSKARCLDKPALPPAWSKTPTAPVVSC